MKYIEYIHSPEWQNRRNLFLQQHGKICNMCPRTDEIEVHHVSYDRLGHERDEDLKALCVRCHNDLHYALRKWPASEIAIRQFVSVTRQEYEQVTDDIPF